MEVLFLVHQAQLKVKEMVRQIPEVEEEEIMMELEILQETQEEEALVLFLFVI